MNEQRPRDSEIVQSCFKDEKEQDLDPISSLLSEGSSRRDFLSRWIATLVSLLVGSAASRTASAAPREKTLVVAMNQGTLRTLDPCSAYEPEWPIFGKAMYDQLVTYFGPNIKDLAPDYAKTWEVSADGLTYVFNLNPNIKFSDGTPATPEDLVFSFRRLINLKAPPSYLLDGVKAIEKTGPQQLKITLDSINVGLQSILTTPSLNIAKASIIKAHGGTDALDASKTDTAGPWLDQHSVGSGPFVLVHWTRGSELVLKRNPNYWGHPAPVDNIIFKFVSDPSTQRDLLVRGDAHIALNLTPDIVDDIMNRYSSKISIVKVSAVAPVYLGWDVVKNPALAKRANWDAIKFAIDYDGLRAIYKGSGDYIGSCTPPELAGGLPREEHMRQDLQKAKSSLVAAGNADGFSFTFTYGTDEVFGTVHSPDMAEKLRADLARVGIKANLNPMLFSQAQTANREGKLESYLHWWSLDFASWTDSLPYFAAGGHVSGPRFHWDANSSPEARQIADLSDRALKTVDEKSQLQTVMEGQRLLNKYGPYAWLFEAFFQFGVRKDIVKKLDPNAIWFFEPGTIELA
jgi:peptide/nickel transport system substrate-binding protein